MFDHKRTAINKGRQLWQAWFNIHEGRATGQLLWNNAAERDFKNIKITDGRFKVDLGGGSGAKVTFKI